MAVRPSATAVYQWGESPAPYGLIPCMSARATTNALLRRLTGYELRRSRRNAGRTSPRDTAAAARHSKPVAVPKDFDDEMADIVRAVRPYTMTSFEKLHATITAARYVARYDIPGDIVECGVWRGGSMQAIARTLDSVGVHDRELYLYDTFEGMTAPDGEGRPPRRRDGRRAAGHPRPEQRGLGGGLARGRQGRLRGRPLPGRADPLRQGPGRGDGAGDPARSRSRSCAWTPTGTSRPRTS